MAKILILLLIEILLSAVTYAGKFTANDYKYAEWMTTRFYGGQRSGTGPNWLLIGHDIYNHPEYSAASFIKDADGSYDLTGGWFDCGDHVKFGQTEFYAVYSLLKAYDVFPEGFQDLYSADYSGYVSSGNWDSDGGTPNGIPDVLDEVNYAIDYVEKCVKDKNTFYFQVGNGNYDHVSWITSAKMSTKALDGGGEATGSREVFSSNTSAKGMSSLAAASLALYSILYKSYDSKKAAAALEKAKIAFEYAKNANGSVGAMTGNFYPAYQDPAINADFVTAAIELYRATGDDSYLEYAKTSIEPNYWALCYANTNEYALYNQAKYLTGATQIKAEGAFDQTIDGNYKPASSTLYSGGDNTWGPLRYNASAAFAVALYSDLNNTNKYDDFIYKQIDYILGDNDASLSFVVGFDKEGVAYVQHPHHRNYYNNDSNPADKNALSAKVPEKNKRFGYMIGGSRNASSYQDNVDTYQGSEGGIDYNAGLVGALSYIVARTDPQNVKEIISTKDVDIKVYPNPFNPVLNIKLSNVNNLNSVKIYNVEGKIIKRFNIGEKVNNLQWTATSNASGVYFVKAFYKNNMIKIKKAILLK